MTLKEQHDQELLSIVEAKQQTEADLEAEKEKFKEHQQQMEKELEEDKKQILEYSVKLEALKQGQTTEQSSNTQKQE